MGNGNEVSLIEGILIQKFVESLFHIMYLDFKTKKELCTLIYGDDNRVANENEKVLSIICKTIAAIYRYEGNAYYINKPLTYDEFAEKYLDMKRRMNGKKFEREIKPPIEIFDDRVHYL